MRKFHNCCGIHVTPVIHGNCKKITIATFQSGNVIITGARQNIQTKTAYEYINKLFSENLNYIQRTSNIDNLILNNNKLKLSSKIEIKIDKIINYDIREKLKQINL